MRKNSKDIAVVTGIGITSSIGQGKRNFTENLFKGSSSFSIMSRTGRQKDSSFVGAEISDFILPKSFSDANLRTISYGGKVLLLTVLEAYQESKLEAVSPARIGLVIGGSNLQQRELVLTHEKYSDTPHNIRPHYGFSFMDTDLSALCCKYFNICGPSYTLGGASASGQLAFIQAVESVLYGNVDVCIAVGALMDLSYFELYAFEAMGAMIGSGYPHPASQACRPCDEDRAGFVFGENCAALVIEKKSHAKQRGILPYAEVSGWAVQMDGHRDPEPDLQGRLAVIEQTLQNAQVDKSEIDYVNPHATGSKLGDQIELTALEKCGLHLAYMNTTKSIVGHGLTAAGAVEVATILLQMKSEKLHPSLNLDHPASDFNWVRSTAIHHPIKNALNLSFGFGGMNTAVCFHLFE